MDTKTIPYAEWHAFFFELGQQFAGSPTTIRVRDNQPILDNQPKRHGLELVSDLPLVTVEYDLRPKETIRFGATHPSGASTTVEIEFPRFITILEEVGASTTTDKRIVFEIETTSQTYLLQVGLTTRQGAR